MEFKGAIFDLDGVVTETARVHSEAWKQMFDEFLKDYYKKHNKKFISFDKKTDYLKYVDGKPRLRGAEDFLNSRSIKLPLGTINDTPDKKTTGGLARKKNLIFLELLKKNKPKIYPTTISFIKKLRKKNVKIALISSSKNCESIINVLKIKYLFDVVVDGKISEKAGLSGKPNPDIFIYATDQLGFFPGECVVFEDAHSGVEAGLKGSFGMVVGIARRDSKILKEADKIISDLKELKLKHIEKWFRKGILGDTWKLKYFDFAPDQEKIRETLCTVGNGYLGLRGCFETQSDSENHYPGFYIAGIYNELKTSIKRKTAINNSLVNCPNWLLIKLKIKDSLVDPFKNKILEYKKILNFKEASVSHKIVFEDEKGRVTQIKSKRIASMHNPHLCAVNFELKPVNYSEKITLFSFIDGDVKNNNVERYKGLKAHHLNIVSKGKLEDGIFLNTKTKTSEYEISISTKNYFNLKNKKKVVNKTKSISEQITFNAKKGKSYSLNKIVSIFTSRESKNPGTASISLLKDSGDFNDVFRKHKSSWKKLWDKADIFIKGDRSLQKILRLHTYHLLSTYSFNVKGLDLGIPARGLHGEAYRGHIFWDEIYILPFFIQYFPELAKEALMYRYNRLIAAKNHAKENSYSGALYPWQSADSGKEETQTIHYNPIDGKWGADFSQNQRHINIAVFYNFYKYLTHTKDLQFLHEYASPVMIEIARFFATISKFDKKTKKYHIKGVMGPDEFHEKYPWSKNPGINDNAYTNIMVSWLFKKTFEILETLPTHIKERLNIKKSEMKKWEDIRKKLKVEVKKGIIMQFENFDKLKDLKWENYRNKYVDISRMDRILKAEGKSPNNYKVVKQPDALMVFYLLGFDEAVSILRSLGIKIKNPKKFIQKNYNYYLNITTHGSTLSRFIHSAIAVNLKHDKKLIWSLFKSSLEQDLYGTLRGSIAEGIHTGLMAGTINVVRKYFAGVKTHEKGINIKPSFPR